MVSLANWSMQTQVRKLQKYGVKNEPDKPSNSNMRAQFQSPLLWFARPLRVAFKNAIPDWK
jgi:hypothetical protein